MTTPKIQNSNEQKSRRKRRLKSQRQQAPTITVNVPAAPPPTQSFWRDSPIIIAALTAIGTATFWHNVILPSHNAMQGEKIMALQKQLVDLEKEASKVPLLTEEVASLEGRLWHAEHANAFDKSSAYPDKFKTVKIGDSVESILSAFDFTSIDQSNPGYWVVTNQHSIFKDVVYYFDNTEPSQPITHIYFVITPSNDSSFLSRFDEKNIRNLTLRLTDTYGKPEVNGSERILRWSVDENVNLYQFLNETAVMIMPPQLTPKLW